MASDFIFPISSNFYSPYGMTEPITTCNFIQKILKFFLRINNHEVSEKVSWSSYIAAGDPRKANAVFRFSVVV